MSARGRLHCPRIEWKTSVFHTIAATRENAFKNPRTSACTTLRPCCASACQRVGLAQKTDSRHPKRYGKASPAIPAVGKGTWIATKQPAFSH